MTSCLHVVSPGVTQVDIDSLLRTLPEGEYFWSNSFVEDAHKTLIGQPLTVATLGALRCLVTKHIHA